MCKYRRLNNALDFCKKTRLMDQMAEVNGNCIELPEREDSSTKNVSDAELKR